MHKVLGIHYGHNATVAYLENGQIKSCVSEERFNRLKNSTGWPKLSLDYIKQNYSDDFDLIILAQRYPWGYEYLKKHNFISFAPGQRNYIEKERQVSLKTELLVRLFPDFYYQHSIANFLQLNQKAEADKSSHNEASRYFKELLGVAEEKILLADHHLCHALSAGFFLENIKEKTLIFTLDGEGDGLCATVNIWENGQLKVLSAINRAFSLGYLYLATTVFLGMKPNEHEFKVMGLAPYAKKEYVARLTPLFEKILWLNDKDEFESRIPMPMIKYWLRENFSYQRFDNIAGAIQEFAEKITLDWIDRWVRKTGIDNIALAGGVFMNVKMNQKIREMASVAKVSVVPSAGDETTVLGACFYGQSELCRRNNLPLNIAKIRDLYLGVEYSDKEIEDFLRTNGYFEKYKISQPAGINQEIARLLSQNQVVARFSGKMEFGARALGSRSILADPSSYENVKLINEMIKNRDFWMPFAATILAEDASRYLVNFKNIDASFMAITFDTTAEAQKDLAAAIHPYDKTSRPQVLTREFNTDYYELIVAFKKLTGIGAVLNTSFNLHGEPNVCSPKDALHTLDDSGLKYLAIGRFLVCKK